MEITCYEKIFYQAEQFEGKPQQIKKYGLKRQKASNGLIRFFLGRRRVPVGAWIVHKRFDDKLEIVDDYGFNLRFSRAD